MIVTISIEMLPCPQSSILHPVPHSVIFLCLHKIVTVKHNFHYKCLGELCVKKTGSAVGEERNTLRILTSEGFQD